MDCVHHWLIGQAVDGVADGTCQKCGATRAWARQFQEEYRDWKSTRGALISRPRRVSDDEGYE